METDHKPLVPLLGIKDIDLLPPRIQRLRLRLMRFSYNIVHVPGNELYTADILSRAPQLQRSKADDYLQQEVVEYVSLILSGLPATDVRLEQIRNHQHEDEICHQIVQYCENKIHELNNPYGGQDSANKSMT